MIETLDGWVPYQIGRVWINPDGSIVRVAIAVEEETPLKRHTRRRRVQTDESTPRRPRVKREPEG